jgi:hypothetical protein
VVEEVDEVVAATSGVGAVVDTLLVEVIAADIAAIVVEDSRHTSLSLPRGGFIEEEGIDE